MAGDQNQSDEECGERRQCKKWKSEKSHTQAYVCFINRTTRRVNVIWVDYEGYGVRYCTLQPRAHVNVNTFVGHPWVFWDYDSGDRLIANMQDVYEPVASQSRRVVVITIPVFKLQERCIQVMRRLIPLEQISNLEISRGLQDEIMRPIPWATPIRGIYEPQTQTVQYNDDIDENSGDQQNQNEAQGDEVSDNVANVQDIVDNPDDDEAG